MRLNLFALFFCLSATAHATQLRIAGSVGFGTSTSSNEVTKDEGPLAQIYDFEYLLNTKNVLGVEHYRSFAMAGMATSISGTGLSYRYYLNSAPGPYLNIQAMPVNTFQVRDISYYVGAAAGLAQSSFPPDLKGKIANAAGIYVDPKIGLELPLRGSMGFRGEFNFLMTVMGTGSINSMALSAGVYYMF